MNGRNRRRKDVPFNPFAQNAAAERNRRHAEKAKEKRRLDAQNQAATSPTNISSKNKTLQELQEEARKKLSADNINPETELKQAESVLQPVKQHVATNEPEPTITETTAVKSTVTKATREDRLAELKRKSQQSKDNAKATKSAVKNDLKIQDLVEAADPEIDSDDLESPIENLASESIISESANRNLNVFKTIQTVDKSSAGISKKKRKTRRIDKKGGGRQRLEKKLNRQKILEFKYVAREILSHPDIPEEHRSNVLGQIIAKGERISIDAAIDFIEQKQEEMILTQEISDKLKQEIKSISTRR
ncbi:MAG: hypothetical protein VX023_04050 [Candidatus Thermoplasmatota archaeon]|nr:hypothetical protein [Candidatus Thermoplasmatota archaeon]